MNSCVINHSCDVSYLYVSALESFVLSEWYVNYISFCLLLSVVTEILCTQILTFIIFLGKTSLLILSALYLNFSNLGKYLLVNLSCKKQQIILTGVHHKIFTHSLMIIHIFIQWILQFCKIYTCKLWLETSLFYIDVPKSKYQICDWLSNTVWKCGTLRI